MYSYKTVIFDLDGTLFKADTVFIDAINHFCISKGIKPIDKERLLKLIGKPSSAICRELFGESFSEEEVQDIRAEIKANEDKLINKSAQLYEGVKKMLSDLQNEGYTLGIYTNGSSEYMNKILSHFNIEEYFQIKKPRVEGLEKFQIIKQILDENAICSAIIVGDTSIDFEAADAARCLSVGVSYGYGGDDFKKSDFIADNPADIPKIISKINGIYKEIAAQIINKKQSNKPMIVGINGVDTAGKSTFTKELARYLFKVGFKSQVISIDDFHNSSNIRNKEKDPIISYLNNAFDLAKIENEIMKPIVSENKLDTELLLLNLERDEFVNDKKYVVDEDTIVLFEGVLLYRQPLNEYFNMRIFIDVSFDEVLKRASKRDSSLLGEAVIEKYNKKYIPIQKLYMEQYNPKELSDIIVDNNDYLNPVIIKTPSVIKKKSTRVQLKKLGEEHLNEIIRMLQDDEAKEMLGVIEIPSLSDYKGKNNISYAIVDENNKFIGIVELFNISWKNRRGELSIAIKSSMRSKGYGYDAINKILEVGFLEYGLNRIWLRVLETNIKAINLYKKVGFSQEGICRAESLRKGQFINQVQMSVLAKEWISIHMK